MDNKILVMVYVPILNQEYDCFIPIGGTIGMIKKTIVDTIGKFNEIEILKQVKVFDKDSSILYDDNKLVKDVNMKNGTKLLLI